MRKKKQTKKKQRRKKHLRSEGVDHLRAQRIVGRVIETPESRKPEPQDNTVVFLDLCSSSKILDECKKRDKLGKYQDMLIRIKNFLMKEELKRRCEVYKFIGDGWILLLPYSIPGKKLMALLHDISSLFYREMEDLLPKLVPPPEVHGVTFGVERGELLKLVMNNRIEYLGRPLNVAARLQGALKDNDDRPAYKVLFSKSTFEELGIPKIYHAEEAIRKLRNIEEGDYPCVKVTVLNPLVGEAGKRGDVNVTALNPQVVREPGKGQ